jgi:membrane-associated protease RseP (regulator of RpoE activity)
MTSLVYALGVVLFFLGVVASIALHEVGHMVPAKKFGVKVTHYFVGFGRTVWSLKRGDTEYGVKAFPLGGFIKMIGMLPPEKRDADGRIKTPRSFVGRFIADARAAEYENITPADDGRLFYKLPWWKKVIVMAGGPMMNVFLAVMIFGAVFLLIGIAKPTTTVSSVSRCVLPATQQVSHCKPGATPSPANAAGVKPGDTIVSIDGTQISTWDQFSDIIRRSTGKPLAVVVDRHGRQVHLTATPTSNTLESLGNPANTVTGGFLGVSPTQSLQPQNVAYVFTTMGSYTKQTGAALIDLPSRLVGVAEAAFGQPRSADSPMSVVGAGRVAGEVASSPGVDAEAKVAELLTLLGAINLFVALFNFIPLLPLDGGHIAGALYEALRRAWARLRRLPDPGYADVAKMLPIAYVAASVILVMGVLLIWADIVNPIKLS